jgi:sugar (pentulose or hexulose) kinase
LTTKSNRPTSVVEEILEQLRVEEGASSLTELTKDLHIYPDFHGLPLFLTATAANNSSPTGNRSPIADPRMRGSITGLEISSGLPDLAKKYNATLESIALQTRHIISVLNNRGHTISSIYMSGGQAKNIKLMQLFADVCEMPVVLPQDSSAAVDRGAAILGRFAAEGGGKGEQVDQAKELWKVMVWPSWFFSFAMKYVADVAQVEMTPPGTLVVPSASAKDKRLLNAKYKIFMEAIDIQRRWRAELEEAARG